MGQPEPVVSNVDVTGERLPVLLELDDEQLSQVFGGLGPTQGWGACAMAHGPTQGW
jgi:hypothetical protein